MLLVRPSAFTVHSCCTVFLSSPRPLVLSLPHMMAPEPWGHYWQWMSTGGARSLWMLTLLGCSCRSGRPDIEFTFIKKEKKRKEHMRAGEILSGSFRGPGLIQHSHGSSQSFVTPALGAMTPSHRHACSSNTNAHKKGWSGYRKNWRGRIWSKYIHLWNYHTIVSELGMVTTLYPRYSENWSWRAESLGSA